MDPLAALFKEHLSNNTIPTGQRSPFNVPQTMAPQQPQGLVVPGNIDLGMQPRIPNEDGSISSVRSASFQDEYGREVLIPTVAADGSKLLSMPEAINQYKRTGKHLGMFVTPDHADVYATALHNAYARGQVKGQAGVSGSGLDSIGPRNVRGGNTLF